MLHAVPAPENDTSAPDGFERLEQLQRKSKEEAEAWQKLLESLGKMRDRPTDNPETTKPSE